MSRKRLIIIATCAWAGLFALAWQCYPALMHLILPEDLPIVALSATEAMEHQFWSALAMSTCAPALIGGFRLVTDTPQSPRSRMTSLFVLLSLGIVTFAGALWRLKIKLSSINLLDAIPVSLPISIIPLYQLGMWASLAIALAALLLKWMSRR